MNPPTCGPLRPLTATTATSSTSSRSPWQTTSKSGSTSATSTPSPASESRRDQQQQQQQRQENSSFTFFVQNIICHFIEENLLLVIRRDGTLNYTIGMELQNILSALGSEPGRGRITFSLFLGREILEKDSMWNTTLLILLTWKAQIFSKQNS